MQHYRCWAEVDLGALRENLAWIRHRVGRGVQVMTVVKADAYGHGLKPIAAHLMQSGTDIFGVANLQEARSIRAVGRGWPILMLGACLPHERDELAVEQVMPTLSTIEEAKSFSAVARKHRKSISVHVKIDTGMGRLGVAPEEAPRLVQQARTLQGLVLEGIYTHFSSAEHDPAFTKGQVLRFRQALKAIAAGGIHIPSVHINNSAGILYEPDTVFNLVRPGLLVYGVVPPGKRRQGTPLVGRLRPALALKCRVGLVKQAPKGAALSYGHTFVAPRSMRVAVLTAGYGDGYPRAGSNRAEVLIGGKRCRVLGRITMDQTLVDVSRVANVRAGNEAVLIGSQGTEEIGVAEVASWCGTIPWEILTNITYRVPRIYRGINAA
jgi:alanine racemase